MSMASFKKLLILGAVLVVLVSISNGVVSYGEKEVLSLKNLEWSLRSGKANPLPQNSSMYISRLMNACLLGFLM